MANVSFRCGMRYSVVLGADGPHFVEHPQCEGNGIIANISPEQLERNRQQKLQREEEEITVICPKCGTKLNWYSGNFKLQNN